MSENLSDFLIDLAADPGRLARFDADPVRELDQSSLNGNERASILARDTGRIREALGASLAGARVLAAGKRVMKKKKATTPKKKKSGSKK